MKKCGACGYTFMEGRIQPLFAEDRTLSAFLARKEIRYWEEVCMNCGSNDIEYITHELQWRTEKPPDSPQRALRLGMFNSVRFNGQYI